MKKASKLLALVIALCMVLSISAFASGEASGSASGGMGMPGGGSAPTSYDAVLDVTEDTEIVGQTMESVNGDENIIHVYEGATAKISDSGFVNGGAGSSGDASSFYGVGATLFVSDGEMYVDNVDIDSTTAGGAGVFAYSDGVAYVRNADIHTTQGSAGGLHVAGGGTLYAWDCNVETEAGMAAAAIRSDRGGGVMVIDGGSYVTNGGTGAVYVTADISVHNAYLYTGGSEAIAIEGKNTIRLFDCELEGSMIPGAINDNKVWNIIVYQSMSGDADVGTSHYEMVGGKLTTNAGPIVYNTNTSSYITFSGVDIVRGDDTTYFLQVTGNSSSRTWGSAGKNGANCIFTAVDQVMPGDVVYDTISNLDLYILEGSSLEGAFTLDECWATVEAAEKCRRHCYMLENCVYDFFELTTLNMAQKGLFGEIIHAEGGYIHTLDEFWDMYWSDWRMRFNRENRGDVYPTHGIGPVCQALNIHRGDRMTRLVSMDTHSWRGKELWEKKYGPIPEGEPDFQNGDHTMTMIQTEKGKTILIEHDVMTPRPYDRLYQLTGTKGFANKYPVQGFMFSADGTGAPVEVENLSAHKFVPDAVRDKLLEEYKHPITRELEESAKRVGGHGGMDYIMDYRLIYCLRNGLPLDMDVYDLAEWSCLVELSRISLEHGGAPVEIPDFTRGAWNKQQGLSFAL